MFNIRNSCFKYLLQITSYPCVENKDVISRQIGDLFIEQSEQLIGELVDDPTHIKNCCILSDRLKKMDEKLSDEFQPTIDSIQKMAALLRRQNIKEIDLFVEQLLSGGQQAVPDIIVPSGLAHLYAMRLPDDIERVRMIPHPIVRAHVMAALINRHAIPIKSLSLTKQEMMQMAPFLSYVDVQGAFDGWNRAEIHRFLDSLKYVTTLSIDSNKVERLPSLPYCRKLVCWNLAVSAFPELPLCEIFDCQRCMKLKALPLLPVAKVVSFHHCGMLQFDPDDELLLCERFTCNSCAAVRVLPLLPVARVVSCDDCKKLQFAENDRLALCEEFSCCGCITLNRLPELPVARIVACHSCLELMHISFLRCCVELDCRWCPNLRTLAALPVCERINRIGCSQLDQNSIPFRFRTPFLHQPIEFSMVVTERQGPIVENGG